MLSGLQILAALFLVAWLLIAVALLVDKRWPLGVLDDAVLADDRLLDDLGSAIPGVVEPIHDDLSGLFLSWRQGIEQRPMPDMSPIIREGDRA